MHCLVWVFLTVCDVSFTGTYVFCWQFVTLVPLPLFCMCSVWLFRSLVSGALFWLCSFWFFVTLVFCALFWIFSVGVFITLVPHTMFCMCGMLTVCYVRVLHTGFYVFCWLFVTQVSRALFRISFFLLFVTLVPCALFCMCCVRLLGLLMPYALFWLFFKIFCYVSVLCTVLNVFCRLLRSSVAHRFLCVPFPFCRSNLSHTWVFFTVCYVKVSHTVLHVFCWLLVTLVPCAVFCMCSV